MKKDIVLLKIQRFYKNNYLILERYRAWRLFYGGVRRYYCWIFYESDIKSIEILD